MHAFLTQKKMGLLDGEKNDGAKMKKLWGFQMESGIEKEDGVHAWEFRKKVVNLREKSGVNARMLTFMPKNEFWVLIYTQNI